MPYSFAISSTGTIHSRSKTPSSGSQVDQTDSPIRITVNPAAFISSKSWRSRSVGWYSW